MQTVKLRDILLNLESGKRPKGWVKDIKSWVPSIGAEHLFIDGWFCFDKIKYVSNDFAKKMTKWILKKNDILVVKDWATSWKTSLVNENFPFDFAVINEHVFLCRCPDTINSKYIFYFLYSNTGNAQILKDFRWAAQWWISTNFVNLVEVPLPSLFQQQAIVDEIEKQFSRLDNWSHSLENIKSNLKNYKASVLKSAVEGKLTEQRRKKNKHIEPASKLLEKILAERKHKREQENPGKKYKEPPKINAEWLSELPEWWCRTSLGESYSVFVWATPSRSNKDYWWWDIKRISSWEVHFNDIYDTEEKITKTWLDNSSTKIHPSWTIMIGMIGEWKTRWQVAMLKVNACHNQNTSAIEVNNNFLSSEYIYYFLYSCYQKMRSIWWGWNQKALNKWIIETIIVPLPPLQEQQKIVQEVEEKLSVIEVISTIIEENIKRAKQLKQSILHQAFTGQLVPMEDDDKWVEQLLAEIEKTKAMLVWQKKTKKSKQK
jgi:type I restriction enzyme S subunit